MLIENESGYQCTLPNYTWFQLIKKKEEKYVSFT